MNNERNNGKEELLRISNLKKYFPASGDWFAQMFDKRQVKAVDGVNLNIPTGDTLGLVGESGSGKTTTGQVIVRLLDPTEGKIEYKSQDITELTGKRLKNLRQEIQMIFQDPSSSLNRRKTVGQMVSEPLKIHNIVGRDKLEEKLGEVVESAGLSKRFLNRYPHEMSGGQRQRVGIARALAVDPEFIVCDEPVTALDVSIQAQILNLLMNLQKEYNLTYLFIAHDLSVVKHVSDRIAVMYLGNIMEVSDSEILFDNPKHPYTQALLAAVPKADPKSPPREVLKGEIPSPIDPPSGCPFHPRCSSKIGEICEEKNPEQITVGDNSLVSCHLYPK
ncbi:ABC transporter ATP-binding protein [Candidatus Bipolaricaulota bacterium]|nr:ABC transporter ATP-binding protein [Candidatus Bipolaricaulota bacterium]